MVTVVSMSPAIDRRLEYERFVTGGTNRVVSSHSEGAGKGIDVALAARALGLDVRCIGLLAGGGAPITERLERNGVPYDFLAAPGAVRTNLKLCDRATGEITESNEASPGAPEALLAEAADRAVEAAKESRFLVLTGSLPAGCPDGFYAELVERVKKEAPGCRTVLDADGERLLLGIKAGPWLIKPNRDELERAAGRPLRGLTEVVEAARALCAGVQVVVVSLGADGAVALAGEDTYAAPSVRVEVRTTTGAGDAMVGGLLSGFLSGETVSGALRYGVAAAASRCAYGGDAFLDAALYRALLLKA